MPAHEKLLFEAHARVGAQSPPLFSDALQVAYEALDALARETTGVSLECGERLGESVVRVLPGGYRGPKLDLIQDVREQGVRLAGLSYQSPPGPRGDPGVRIQVLLAAAGGPGAAGRVLTAGTRTWLGEAADSEEKAGPPRPWLRLGARFGFDVDGFPMPLDARTLDVAGVESELVPLLLDSDRPVPVLVLSPVPITSEPFLDPDSVQRALFGVCPVFALADRRATFPLARSIAAPLACYDGAARLYFPELDPTAPPSLHPMWRPDEQMAEEDFPGAVIERIASRVSISPGDLDWGILSDANLRRKAGSLEGKELETHLRDRERELMARVAELEELLERERRRSASRESQVRALRARLAEHVADADLDVGAARGAGGAATAAGAAIRRVSEAHSDRLVLAPNNRSTVEDCAFQDAKALEAALDCLATTYWDARFGDGNGSDLDLELRRVAPGFFYRPHQSPSTVGRFSGDYHTTWEGRRYELRYHIGKGTSRDPRYSIRVAFAVDEERRRIVIGFIGQHQRTRAS